MESASEIVNDVSLTVVNNGASGTEQINIPANLLSSARKRAQSGAGRNNRDRLQANDQNAARNRLCGPGAEAFVSRIKRVASKKTSKADRRHTFSEFEFNRAVNRNQHESVPRRSFDSNYEERIHAVPTIDTTDSGDHDAEKAKDAFVSVIEAPHSDQCSNDGNRRSSLDDMYLRAQKCGPSAQRKKWLRILVEYLAYTLMACFTYFVLIGLPLWKGAVWWLYWLVSTKFVVMGTWFIFIGLGIFYEYAPLLIQFEKAPEDCEASGDPEKGQKATDTALIIPCYKSAKIVGATLEAALKVFPAENIFVIANGNSQTPLDDTEDVVRPFGINHLWVPIGSKITAQL
jgi:hypothetical protein